VCVRVCVHACVFSVDYIVNLKNLLLKTIKSKSNQTCQDCSWVKDL
jgi:hypothetical protein